MCLRVITIMGLRLIVAICSLLLERLPSSDANVLNEVIIVLPSKNESDEVTECTIANDNCERYIEYLRSYAIRSLNVERFYLSKGLNNKMPVATNMLLLEADEQLEENAQKYAEACVKVPGTQKCPVSGQNDDGEVIVFVNNYNIRTLMSSKSYSLAIHRIAYVIMSWRNKISRVNASDLLDRIARYRTSGTNETLQNIAKLFHAYAWKVGCGIADYYISDVEFKEVIACFYGPPKLNNGDELYIPGCKPCSHCPEGTSCYSEASDTLRGVLCKVELRDKIFQSDHNLPREIMCYPSRKIVPSDVTSAPLDASENDVQNCRGERLCSPGWHYMDGHAFIHVNGKCTSAVIFRDKIRIESESCYMFYYTKKANTPHLTGEVIAFAFQTDDTDNRIKEVQNKEDGHYMFLNIPWTNVYINVGFGTRSQTDGNDYEVEVKNFLVTTGKCLNSA